MIHLLRLEQIAEAMEDLESVFADPHCFHSPGGFGDERDYDPRPVQDYAVSLASEFVGAYRDEEIVNRLTKLENAEDAGKPKDARRHLTFVRRKVAARMAEWTAELAANAAKPQVTEASISSTSPQRSLVPTGTT
jgi:hypothetical protein